MSKILLKLAVFSAVITWTGHSFATGYFGPKEYLVEGGKNLTATPEFYWDLETKRLAREFHPTEKPMVVVRTYGDSSLIDLGPMLQATANADIKDFTDAIQTGEIRPPDLLIATQQNDAARKAIGDSSITDLPAESDSEFADYHRGAFAYRLGPTHWDEAKKAWEALLNRPVSQRHYRTLWATFMLGKLAMKSGDPGAVKWFEQTRELAKQGFADSLGMAADSYGWEGRNEWKQNHPEKAAPLFLTQLALGDESAIVSLKALIPDRPSVEGMLNYDSDPSDASKPENSASATPDPTTRGLFAAAEDPLLRRLVTAHILATGWGGRSLEYALQTNTVRSVQWLDIINRVKPATVEDAEYLGWLAYMDGDYKEAQRWLDLSKRDSPAADWLRAKLQLRAGDLTAAVRSLSQALETLRSPALYTGWTDGAYRDSNQNGPQYTSAIDEGSWSIPAAASGDLGILHLERGDFVQAMDVLLKGGLWEDAAFIAERVLTTNELKAHVDKLTAQAPADGVPQNAGRAAADGTADEKATAANSNYSSSLRYLLGRRLVREDRYAEAAAYFPSPKNKILQKYSAALKDGGDQNLPKLKRAQAWFTAAWLARYDGMELMGTEVAPDGFVSDGAFPNTDLAQERIYGHYGDQSSAEWAASKVAAPAFPKERQRLEQNKIEPDVRFHYRLIAGALAMRAARLMNDNTEELADVVNTAGLWVKDIKEKTGDGYYQVLEQRCAKTQLGAAAIAKHWFVDQQGPWSTEQQNAEDAMHKELGDSPQNGI